MVKFYPGGFTERGAKDGDVWRSETGVTVEIDMIPELSPFAFIKVDGAETERMITKDRLAAWLMQNGVQKVSSR
jgi:hypothetical protein